MLNDIEKIIKTLKDIAPLMNNDSITVLDNEKDPSARYSAISIDFRYKGPITSTKNVKVMMDRNTIKNYIKDNEYKDAIWVNTVNCHNSKDVMNCITVDMDMI